ncbi:MAG: UDP-N-acetylmuramate dehydrogenase [Solirubrobacteraceae bacterium]
MSSRETSQPTPPRDRPGVLLSELTTLRLGGRARRVVEAAEDDEIVATAAAADAAGEPLLVLAGGSNLVIGDDGFDGTVLRIASRGVETVPGRELSEDRVRLLAAAGEPWDGLVSWAVSADLSGIECLSGIPGSAGATPIQNVGAYGQQVSETIDAVLVYDRASGERVQLTGAECRFAYRSSLFRRSDRHIVLGVGFSLRRTTLAEPIRYPELAAALGIAPGARAPLPAVRAAVLALRRAKGMVSDPTDPDSVSAGSFFVNPILTDRDFAALAARAARHLGDGARPPAWPEPDGRVKTSAAWLIERAGFHRGYGAGRVGISSKHTLALVNRGGATTAELLSLAGEIRRGVRDAFGVTLAPEPVLVGAEL